MEVNDGFRSKRVASVTGEKNDGDQHERVIASGENEYFSRC